MPNKTKSLCFFIGYTDTDNLIDIPYIIELQQHFDEVIVLTNVEPETKIYQYIVLPNIGYDFGYLYRALQNTDLSNVNRLGIVNNSNILLKSKSLNDFFNWLNTVDSNFAGITDSFEIHRKRKENKAFHLQSHFLILQNEAVDLLSEFFREIKFERFFKIKNRKKLRKLIIKKCEIGISQFMIKHDQKPASYFSAEEFNPRYNLSYKENMHVELWEQLIQNDYPLIKKKIVSGEWDNIISKPENKFLYI